MFSKFLTIFLFALVGSLLVLFGLNTLFKLGIDYSTDTVLACVGLFYTIKFVTVSVFDSLIIRSIQLIANLTKQQENVNQETK